MALEDVIIPVDFGQGVDTKTDSKQVIPGKARLIYDGIFTNTKRLTKRNGYDALPTAIVGGGNISNPKLIKTYIRNQVQELVTAATGPNGNRLFSYSPTEQGWVDKGKYNSISVSKTAVVSQIPNQSLQSYGPGNPASSFLSVSNSNSVILGNLILTSYDNLVVYGGSLSFISVIDQTTGTHLVDNLQIPNALGFAKPVLLGGTTFAVFYMSATGTNRLAMVIVSVSLAGNVTLSSEFVIGTSLTSSATPGTGFYPWCYDVVGTSTGATVVSANQPNLTLYAVSTAGSVTNTATISSFGQITPVNLSVDSSGNYWIYWGSATTNLYYAVYSSSFTVVHATTLIQALPTFLSYQPTLFQVTSMNATSTTQTVFYSSHVYVTPTSVVHTALYTAIFQATVSVSGTVTLQGTFANNLDLYGKIFTVNGNSYLPCCTLSSQSATGFIVDVADGIAAGKFSPYQLDGIYIYSSYPSPTNPPYLLCCRYPGFLTVPFFKSSSIVSMATGYVNDLPTVVQTTASNAASIQLDPPTAAYCSNALTNFDFANIDSYQAVNQQDCLVLNGGVVSVYDGGSVTELGFSVDADNLTAIPFTTGGNIGTGTFLYSYTYTYPDNLGNLYESAPSPQILVNFSSGSTNSVELILPLPTMSQKKSIGINVWKSDSNQGGNISYLVFSVTLPANTNVVAVVATDVTPTITTGGTPTLYTQNGAVLENIAPPAMDILWTNNNRIWGIPSESPETLVEYSKTASSGTGINFSTGLLELVLDSKGGASRGASPMDEKTVIFKTTGACVFIGDGANDSGTGSTITPPQFIPSDVGCSNSKSVILYPKGILFKTDKGIYQLSRGLEMSYFGLEVEQYNSQDVSSAVIVSSKNQIRFLTSNGFSLLYDYVMGQWSAFSNHAGLGGDNWQGKYTYARPDGSIFIENATSFLDNGVSYSLQVLTAWIKVSSIQNLERIRHALLLGNYQNGTTLGHGIQIQAFYDFDSTTPFPAVPYPFQVATGLKNFQYRNFFTRTKCDVISLLITEVTTGASGEYLDLTNMSFMCALKKGHNKLGAARSVG